MNEDEQLDLQRGFDVSEDPKLYTSEASVTLGVLAEVLEERFKQDDRWGEQNHPVFTQAPDYVAANSESYAALADNMKALNRAAVENGIVGWDTILMEELAEAMEQAEIDPAKYREELVQTAAVVVVMIEAHDRKVTNSG